MRTQIQTYIYKETDKKHTHIHKNKKEASKQTLRLIHKYLNIYTKTYTHTGTKSKRHKHTTHTQYFYTKGHTLKHIEINI